MSTPSTIKYINAKLIGLFAVLDSWFDDRNLSRSLDNGGTILDQLTAIVGYSNVVISKIQAQSGKGHDAPVNASIETDFQQFVKSHYMRGDASRIRALLRDVLYDALCTCDELSDAQANAADIRGELLADYSVFLDKELRKLRSLAGLVDY